MPSKKNFNPDGSIKNKIVHKSGEAGGMLVGNRHSNGGIKAINKSTGQPLEMEGGEVVITRNAVSDNSRKSFNGKMLTNREILSEINTSGGGVSFADGGELPDNINYNADAECEYGGECIKVQDVMHRMAKGGEVKDKKLTHQRKQTDDLNDVVGAVQDLQLMLESGGEVKDADESKRAYEIKRLGIEKNKSIGKGTYKIGESDNNLYFQRGRKAVEYIVFKPIVLESFSPDGEDIITCHIKYYDNDNNEIIKQFDSYQSFCEYFAKENKDKKQFFGVRSRKQIYIYFNYLSALQKSVTILKTTPSQNSWKKFTYFSLKQVTESINSFFYWLQAYSNIYSGLKNNRANFLGWVIGEPMEGRVSEEFEEKVTKQKNDEAIANFIKWLTNSEFTSNLTVKKDILTDPKKILSNHTYKPFDGNAYDFVVSNEYPNIYPADKSSWKFLQMLLGDTQTEPIIISAPNLDKYIEIYDKFILDKAKELNLKRTFLTNDEIAVYQREINNLIYKQRQLQEDKDFGQPLSERLKKAWSLDFANIETEYKSWKHPSINSVPTKLTKEEYKTVNTREFKTFFGDWQNAFYHNEYDSCSKVIDQETKEPLAVFHGSDTLFSEFKTYSSNNAHYFAVKREMANFFATSWASRGDKAGVDSQAIKELNPSKGEFIYRCFLDIRNPLDFSVFGVDKRPIRDFLTYLAIRYELKDFDFAFEKQLTEEFLSQEVYAWQIIRTWQSLTTFINVFTPYDGYIFYEFIPDGNKKTIDDASLSFCAFESRQIKITESVRFNGLIEDIRFKRGGKI